jgi:hypothetical protein
VTHDPVRLGTPQRVALFWMAHQPFTSEGGHPDAFAPGVVFSRDQQSVATLYRVVFSEGRALVPCPRLQTKCVLRARVLGDRPSPHHRRIVWIFG